MDLFSQILNQSKLGTSGQFSGGTFGSINTQDFQSKAPAIQKSVQAEQNLINKGFSEKEVKFLKLQKEKGRSMDEAIAFVEQKRQEAKGFASDANRQGFLQNAAGVGADIIGGAISEVPNFLGNTASWMSQMGNKLPTNTIPTAIRAGFSDKTYGELRAEQDAQSQKLAEFGQKGKQAIQSTGLYDPTTTSAKAGEFVTDIAGSIVGPNKVGILKKGAQVLGAGKKLTTTAKIGDIALEGGLAGAKFDVGTKGDITKESVALGAIGNVGIAGALKGGKALANRYTGANISTRANRFTAGDEEKFIKMTGETPGQFATSRGMTAVGEDAVKQSSQFYKASMDKADEALSQIDGSFSTKGQSDDILGDLMEGNLAKIKAQPRNPDATRVKELYNKYESGQGLTMSEINEAKRIYARNHKFTWEQRASDGAVNATNLQNDLRKWQMKLAEESGLENLAEINKTTQAWKAFADSLEKRLDRSGANNLVSLSDWVALSGGNPTNLALFAGKKAFELPGVKSGAIKLFSKQTKPSIIEPTTEKIIKTNLQKKYANPSVSGDMSSISGKSMVKPRALLPAPSKQTIQRKENVELSKKLIKEKQAKEAVTKQSDITSKSKIVRPSVKPSPQVKPVEKTVKASEIKNENIKGLFSSKTLKPEFTIDGKTIDNKMSMFGGKSNIRLKDDYTAPLNEIVDFGDSKFNELAKKIQVKTKQMGPQGSYRGFTIYLKNGLSPKEQRNVISHEFQHFLDETFEGPSGGNKDMFLQTAKGEEIIQKNNYQHSLDIYNDLIDFKKTGNINDRTNRIIKLYGDLDSAISAAKQSVKLYKEGKGPIDTMDTYRGYFSLGGEKRAFRASGEQPMGKQNREINIPYNKLDFVLNKGKLKPVKTIVKNEVLPKPLSPQKTVKPKTSATQANGPRVLGKMGKIQTKTTLKSPTSYEEGMRRPFTIGNNKPIVKRANDIDSGILNKIKGKEITLYRGTKEQSDYSGVGGQWHGAGKYYTDSKAEASLYGPSVKEYKVKLNNPFDLTSKKDIIDIFGGTKGLSDKKIGNSTFGEVSKKRKEIMELITKEKLNIWDGSKPGFKHVEFVYEGKPYTKYNAVPSELDTNYLKEIFTERILKDKYNIDNIPVRVSEAIDPNEFSTIIKRLGYDGIITPNSQLPTGYEYIIFDQPKPLSPQKTVKPKK